MARRKRNPGDKIFYARGRRGDTRGEDAGYFAPPRRGEKEDEPKTSEEPAEENEKTGDE